MYIASIIVLFIAVVALAVVAMRLNGKYKRVAQQRDELAKSATMQKLYLRNMSHQIRTPMNAICGFAQLLSDVQMQEILSDRERTDYGRIIQSNTELLTSLIDDILDLSNMKQGKYRLNIGPCKVNDVCRKSVSAVVHRCPDGVKMYMTSDVDNDFEIQTDSKRVEQVMINFLTNAVKHTTKGEICLHATTDAVPGMLTLSVTDTGEGVPADKTDAIFSRFDHLDDESSIRGIGLAICSIVASQLNGEIKLDTLYAGRGARFVFNVPLK